MSDSENSIKKSGSHVKICREVFDDFYDGPSKEEIFEYALKIGIDPEKEEHLLKYARDGLLQPLPSDWKACYSDQYKAYYYYNKITKITQWEHPLDEHFRIKADKARKRESVDTSDNNSLLDSGISSDNLDLNAPDVTTTTTTPTNQAIFDKMDGLSKIKFLAPIEASGKLAPLKGMKRIGKFEVTNAMPAQISLNISTTSEPTTPPYFTDDQEPPKMPTKGFTLSGMGSMFLKSNTQQQAAEYGLERKKGILRDSSLTDVRHKGVDLKFGDVDGEDKKSVRFVLNEDASKVKPVADNDKGDSSDDDSEDDDWDFHDDVAENFVKEIKVTPIQKQTQIALLKTNASSDETIKRPPMKSAAAFGKTAPTSDMFSYKESIFEIFKKKDTNQPSASSVVKPLYDDSDSESPNDSIKHSPDSKDGKEPASGANNKVMQPDDLAKKQLEFEMTNRLEIFKNELLAKQSEEEDQLRAEMQSNLERLKQEMMDANNTELELFEVNMLKASNKEELEQLLDAEKEKFKQLLNDELEMLKAQQDEQLARELEEHKRKFDELLEQRRKDIEDEHLKEMLAIRQCSEAKLAEIQQGLSAQNEEEIAKYQQKLKDEFEVKRQEISESHRAAVDILQRNHNEMLEELARDLKLEEEIIKKEHTTNLSQLKTTMAHELEMERHRMRETGEDRLYEKIRCEKRLLEDKYRCLKDKYIRLKTDVKISLERRNRRREQQQQSGTNTNTTTGSETERSMSHQKSYGGAYTNQQHDNKNTNNSISYNSETTHSKPPLNISSTPKLQSKLRHEIERDKPQEPAKKFTAASKYLQHLHQQYDDTSVSDSVSNNHYSRAKFIPGGNSDSEAVRGAKNVELFNTFNNNNTPNNNNNNAGHNFTGRQRKKVFTRAKSASTSRLNQSNRHEDRPCTPVENLRRQLEKLENLEEQFPDFIELNSSDYRLRYPFVDNGGHGANTSELDFFKHRIQIERDSLRTQRTNFRVKQRDIKQRQKKINRHLTMDQLFQEEKELAEMEVSLYRTRALLGEKVIRLRHLEQSLQRIYEKDKPFDLLTVDSNRMARKDDGATLSDLSSHSSSGFSSTDFGTETLPNKKDMLQESSDIIISLENLNAEIREIWDILSKQTHGLPPPPSFSYADMAWPLTTGSAVVTPTNITSNIIQNPTAAMPGIPTLADRLETYRQMSSARNQGAVISSTGANTIVSHSLAGHYTTSLVERTRDLRNWLRQAKNEHEILSSGIVGIGQQTDL